MAKTIVFCATEEHAERMRIALSNLNADMVKENPDYVVRITGSDAYGKSKLKPFISSSAKYPVIATTSKLLTTGADCKMTKLIVIDQMINSMTEFKQIIGRGTRLREKEGKTHFTIMDFRGVSRLFADPAWDGEVEQDPDYEAKLQFAGEVAVVDPPEYPEPPVDGKHPKPYVDVNGCEVRIINKTVSVYDTNGQLLRQENIIDYTKTSITGEFASLEDFILRWSEEDRKEAISEEFREHGIDLSALKREQGMDDVDDFDFICHIAYDKKPLTRKERAEGVKKKDFLSKYSDQAREVLEILIDKYAISSIYEIEKIDVLKLDPINKYGAPARIVSYFGGKQAYIEAIHELENELYEVEG